MKKQQIDTGDMVEIKLNKWQRFWRWAWHVYTTYYCNFPVVHKIWMEA